MRGQTRTHPALLGLGLALLLLLGWLSTTDHVAVWPARNTLQDRVLRWQWALTGAPHLGLPGTLRGVVRDPRGAPIAGARVLVARWDGTAYHARSAPDGAYVIAGIPAGRYRPVAGAPGYAHALPGGPLRVAIEAGAVTRLDVVLAREPPPRLTPGQNIALGEPLTLICSSPLHASATRRQVTFDNAGQPNLPTYYYTPLTATAALSLPLLLVVYPGPTDRWECASIPLAAAGYAVLAIGPPYTFEFERDIDELERLLGFVRSGAFPAVAPDRVALLGGSYSGLHVLRLLQRDHAFAAALLFGPPTDLFDMRRRLEEGSFIPPYGLDQTLIALGRPDRDPLRLWRYSGAYHVDPRLPPLALLHSRDDRVVPYQQSELLARTLAEVGVEHETRFFDGASHYLMVEGETDPALRDAALDVYAIALDFLGRHLRPSPAFTPAIPSSKIHPRRL